MIKTNKLQIALLIDSTDIPAWIYTSIKHITNLAFVDIHTVLLSQNSPKIHNSPIQQRINRIMGKLFDNDVLGPDYRELKSIQDLIQVDGLRPYSSDTDLAFLSKEPIDLLISYSNHSIQGSKVDLPFGIWQHSFNDSHNNNPGYEGFWETMLFHPVIGSGLYMHKSGQAKPQAIIRSYSCPDKASVYGTNNLNYWKTASFAARALEKLHSLGDDHFLELCQQQTRFYEISKTEILPAPSNLKFFWQVTKKFSYKLKMKFHNKRFFEQWILRFNINPANADNVAAYQNMLPPKEVFWADPHIIYDNDRYYVFIEELPFSTWKGYLSVIEMNNKGEFGEPVKILEKDYHLSYPNVFKHQGTYYMIPETYDNETIELYECIEFPHKWEFKMNLIEGKSAADTTLLFKEGRWWLFTNIRENDGAAPNDELFLFYSDGDDFMTDKWTPHPLNPIISDVRTARPAGKIYTENGKIYRPSQNCSYHYGYGLNINEITLISETQYKEKLVSTIEPNWDKQIIATHTYNREKDLIMMDAILDRSIAD